MTPFPFSAAVAEKEGSTGDRASGMNAPLIGDDDILAKGGVLQKDHEGKPKAAVAGNVANSIRKEAWQGSSNALVNALRSGKNMEMPHEDLMDLLHGRNLYGWAEGSRNWIGDEMMTMLRQDMPERAYGDLKSVAENISAPAAMRDYAIQHISHLVNDGVAGAEAVEFIRQAYESGDMQVAGTALISLYRISQKQPALLDGKTVLEMAEGSKDSADERLKITAGAILKENGK